MNCGQLLFLTAAALGVIGGIAVASGPQMLLYPLRATLQSKVDRGMFPRWLAKPLLLCETCMASIWGSLIYFMLGPCVNEYCFDEPIYWMYLPVHICSTAFLYYLLWNLISYLRTGTDANLERDRQQHP